MTPGEDDNDWLNRFEKLSKVNKWKDNTPTYAIFFIAYRIISCISYQCISGFKKKKMYGGNSYRNARTLDLIL